MTYEIDSHGRIWANGGLLVPGDYPMWHDYEAWLEAGNKPTERSDS